jgi:hypothetical protein
MTSANSNPEARRTRSQVAPAIPRRDSLARRVVRLAVHFLE